MSAPTDPDVDMDRARWPLVEQFFAVALDTPPEQRDAMLDSDCHDHGVRAEVRRLLARHESLTSSDPAQHPFLAALDVDSALRLLEKGTAQPDPTTIGRYVVQRRLGRGATGAVFLAWDPQLHRRVAIKVLSPWLSADHAGAQRFVNEARAASNLEHPRIAPVYAIETTAENGLYIVMAYLEGITLRERLAAGALPLDEAVRITAEIADVLSAAHTHGIIHRDIKPENILLTDRGACLLDFGIAKLEGETLTTPGTAIGTTAYMSPEQSRGDVVDHRTDLWSLGVVLYEMLTGERPFRGDRSDALIHGIRHDRHASLNTLRADVPAHIVAIVDQSLAKEVEGRPTSAAVMQQQLLNPPRLTLGEIDRGRRAPWVRQSMIAAAIAVPLILASLWRGRDADARTGATTTRRSALAAPAPLLALLPFVSGDSSPDRAYITTGLNDALRLDLTRGTVFRVAAAEAVRRAVTGSADVQTIAARLGAAAVLRGTTRDSGGAIWIDAELLAGADGRTRWSARFRRDADDERVVVDSIHAAILATIAAPAATRAPDAARRTAVDPLAYDLFLRGRFAYDQRTTQGLADAMRYFREAIARDSSFARAYVGLADVYSATQTAVPTERYRLVKPLVARALAADSNLAEAQRTAGWIAMWYDHDWTTAERHLRRALELDPGDIWIYHSYAAWYAAVGRTRESLAMTRSATALDPLSSATATHIGLHLLWNRQYTESIAVLEHALTVDTTWGRTHSVLGRAYLAVGRYDDALRSLRRVKYDYAAFEPEALLTYGLGIAGHTAEARTRIATMEARARGESVHPTDMMVAYLGIGDTVHALDWAERLPDDRGAMFFLLADSIYDPLRTSVRFQRVLERLGLSEYAQRASDRTASLAR